MTTDTLPPLPEPNFAALAEQWLVATARKAGSCGVTADQENLMRIGFLAGYYTAQSMRPEPTKRKDDLNAMLTEILNRRVSVENKLAHIAAGKLPVPDAEGFRALARELGNPTSKEALAVSAPRWQCNCFLRMPTMNEQANQLESMVQAEPELGDRFMEILRSIHGTMPDTFADSARLAFVHALKERAAQPTTPDHVPASPEQTKAVDEALGLFDLPSVRVGRATYASLMESAKARGLILQAVIRERLAPYSIPVQPTRERLTDDQIAEIHKPYLKRGKAGHHAFARAIERLVREEGES